MKLFGLDITRREAEPIASAQESSRVTGATFADHSVHAGSPNTALTVSAWYCGLATKANIFSQLLMEYQKRNDSAHGNNYTIYDRGSREARRLNYLMQVQPNQMMTAKDLWAQAVIDREVYGNAIIYIERDNQYEVANLWLCEYAEYIISENRYNISFNRPGRGTVSMMVDASDVLHWKNTYRTNNRMWGLPTLKYAAQSLSIAATNDAQAMDVAAKGGKYKIILKEEQQADFALNLLNKEQREAQANQMQEAINRGDDVISVNGLITPTIISQTADQMNLLDSRKWDTAVVARFLQMPLVLLMDYTNNTYKAPEQTMQHFLNTTIASMAKEVECECIAKLLGAGAYPTLRFKFNNSELMRLDPKGRMEVAKMQLECGIKCVNELRADFDLPSIEKDGDTHLVSTNLQRLDDIKVGKNQATEQPSSDATKNNKPKDEEDE